MSTATAEETLKVALNTADPDKIADAFQKVALGDMFTIQEYDTGVIAETTAITLPLPGAWHVQSVRCISNTSGLSVGHYIAGNSASTPLKPVGGADTGIGIVRVSVDGRTITFAEADITQAVVRYIKRPAVALTAAFKRA